MRHHSNIRTLSRSKRQRTALLRGLAVSLITHGRIVTTEAKAKELRPFAERLITTAKTGSIAARRTTSTRLGEPDAKIIVKLFELGTRYKERAGGYTRIVKMGRTAAGRDMAVIELV